MEVVLKKEQSTNSYTAFIQKQDATYKGIIIKVTSNLNKLMSTFAKIKNNANESENEINELNELNYIPIMYKYAEYLKMGQLNQEEYKQNRQISESIKRFACSTIQYHLIMNRIM